MLFNQFCSLAELENVTLWGAESIAGSIVPVKYWERKGKRPREIAQALGQWTYYKDVQLTVTKLGVYSVAVFHSTLSFAPFRVLPETVKVAPSAMVI